MPMGKLIKVDDENSKVNIINDNIKEQTGIFIPTFKENELPNPEDIGMIIYVEKKGKKYTAVTDGIKWNICEKPI